MKTEGRTWAIGILAIIVIGIILIVASIIISSSQSIDVDMPFGDKRKVVDKTINDIMAIQNEFEKNFDAYIGINQAPQNIKANALKNPYYNAYVPKDKPPQSEWLNKNSVLYIHFEPKSHIDANANKDIKISKATLEMVRLMQGDKKITKIEFPMRLDSKYTYKTDELALPISGYYQANFTIEFEDKDSEQDSKKEAYFSRWLFNEE